MSEVGYRHNNNANKRVELVPGSHLLVTFVPRTPHGRPVGCAAGPRGGTWRSCAPSTPPHTRSGAEC